jgi:hypothetical protein
MSNAYPPEMCDRLAVLWYDPTFSVSAIARALGGVSHTWIYAERKRAGLPPRSEALATAAVGGCPRCDKLARCRELEPAGAPLECEALLAWEQAQMERGGWDEDV